MPETDFYIEIQIESRFEYMLNKVYEKTMENAPAEKVEIAKKAHQVTKGHTPRVIIENLGNCKWEFFSKTEDKSYKTGWVRFYDAETYAEYILMSGQ